MIWGKKEKVVVGVISISSIMSDLYVVIVRNMYRPTPEDIKSLFPDHHSYYIPPDDPCHNFVHVNFKTREQADNAIATHNGQIFRGSELDIVLSRFSHSGKWMLGPIVIPKAKLDEDT
ncbi:hypothetical protein MKW92_041812 [Papaver armeniacum]|nr:hypothetical protein MKW92_041812 [Papaver armeniacum]